MASDITLSKGVRSNLLSLQSTAELLGRTQERLSTGKKVNSALDNPINFFTSSGLSARANDLSRLLDSVGNGVQTINAADKGITAIKKLIESAQATARQALTAAEGTTTYAVSQTGSVAISADVAATGTGTVAIAADVAAVTGGNTFASMGALQAEEMATATLDTTNFAAAMTDGETLTIDVDGTTYTFTAQDNVVGVNGTPANTFYFDTQDGATGLRDSINTALAGIATAAIAGNDLTVTAVNASEEVTIADGTTSFGAPAISDTDYVAADTFTINDGGGAATLTYVAAGASAAAGTFTTLADLADAINHANAGQNITASTTGGGTQLRLVADSATDTITVGGSVGTGAGSLGFAATAYNNTNAAFNSSLAALAGQSITIESGSTSATYNFTSTSTRAALVSGLSSVATLSGNNLSVTAANNTDEIEISGTATASVWGATTAYSPTNAQVAGFTGQLNIQLGSGSVQSVEFGNGAGGEITTRAALVSRLAEISDSLDGVTISLNGSNIINVASTSDESVTIGGGAAASFGLTAATYAPTETTTENATRASLQSDFNNLLSQITTLARDASYNGVNLLNGDNLSVIFNEDGTSSLSITGVDFSATGLGLTNVTGSGFQSNTAVNASLAQLDTATASLRTQSSRFGSNLSIVQTRQDFTKNLISVLQTGADNLVLADTNEEGANMLALQTRQQLSSVALSMASQADQNVLRLF